MPIPSADAPHPAAILHSLTEALVVTDPAGVITLVNPAAVTLLALEGQQVVGQPLSAIHAELEAQWARAIREAQPEPLAFELVLDGGRQCAASLAPVWDEGRQALGWLVRLGDVTQLKPLARWKSEALDTVAHDVRNPLNLIIGSLNLLRDLLPDPTPEQKECLSMIQYSAERIMALTEGLLAAERAEAGTDLAFAPVPLRAVIRDVVGDFRRAAEEKDLRLEFEAPLVDVEVLGDEVWLHRAAGNLVSNAIKYTPAGGWVRVRCYVADGQGIVEVTDNGPGIPPEAQARLFQRFYRVPSESTRNASGSGLGLAIVKTTIERHGGRVWVSSAEGQGSTFGFSLPLRNTET
jgi:PAS domain S-box-containing protein